MDQTLDRPHREAASGARRWRMLKTVPLLLAGAFASLLMVELPATLAGGETDEARRHVPAADNWILLGSEGSGAVAPATAHAPDTATSDIVTTPRSVKRRPRAASKSTRHPARAVAGRRRNAEKAKPLASDAATKHQRRARGV